MAFIKDTPPPATVILISSDRDFAYLLSTVRWRKYNVVLISNSSVTHGSLTSQASVMYDWKSDILDARPPSKPPLFVSRTLCSVASLTNPQESDKPSESEAYPIGLPNERIAPAIQPLILSPRPVSTTAVNAIHPTSPTAPDSPHVVSEVTRIPPIAGSPIEAASASIPSNSTSNGRGVARLTGELTMVYLSIVRGIIVDFVFKQDFVSPKTPEPVKVEARRGFEDLIVVLSQLSANGGPAPRFSTVFSLWKDRKPAAFETVSTAKFKAYLRLADSAGIIAFEQHQAGDGWVTLCHRRNTDSNSPPQHDASRFRDLIEILNDYRLAGDPEPRFFTVSQRLLRTNPSVFEDAGVTEFEEYVRGAAEAGIVTVRGVGNSDCSLKLCLAYCSPPPPSPTLTRTDSTPPTLTASNNSPFAPLVEFLKTKQLASAQPISFAKAFNHLVSALGYDDMASLCTSVPGVTTFGQYLDAAIDSGLVSLVGGTTASRDALVSLPVGLPGGPPSLAPQHISTTPPLSVPLPQETAVSSPSVNVTPNFFWDLTAVLTELSASTGESAFWFSSVIPLLMKRKPDAYASVGVTGFTDYVTLAVENGIVKVGAMDRYDGLVSFNNPKLGGPATSLRSSQSSGGEMVADPPSPVSLKGGGVDTKFVDLVETLGRIRKKGEKKPFLSLIGSELLAVDGGRARTLDACGVSDFNAYAQLAKNAGVIDIHGLPGEETMSLDPMIRVKAGYT